MSSPDHQLLEPLSKRQRGKEEPESQHPTKFQSTNMRGLCAPGTVIVPCDRQDCRRGEKRFKSCLSVHANEDTLPVGEEIPSSIVLDALVLDNNICVLVLPRSLSEVQAASYHQDYLIDIADVSGKFKRGAKSVTALTTIASVVVKGQNEALHTINLQSPIAGKIVEINDLLAANPRLLTKRHRSEGYLAVVTSEAPSVLERSGAFVGQTPVDVFELTSKTKGKEKICYSWIKGKCNRGSACKFKHVDNEQ